MKHYPNFGLKVIKITTKSDLDKDHYLIFPPITKNHYYIRTPSGTWNQNKGSYCTPRTPARVANVQKYNLEQWFSIYGQFTHFGYNLVFTAIFCRQPLTWKHAVAGQWSVSNSQLSIHNSKPISRHTFFHVHRKI